MLTAGLLTLIEGVVLVVWGSQPYALPPFSGEAPVDVLGVRVPTQGLWIAGAAPDRNRGAVVSARAHHARQGAARLRREPAGGAADGHRRAAHDALELRPRGDDRRDRRHRGRADHVAAIRYRAVFHHLRLHRRRDRRHGLVHRRRRRRAVLGVAEQLAAGYVSSLFANALALVLLLVDVAVAAERPVHDGVRGAGRARRAADPPRHRPLRGARRAHLRRRSRWRR